MLYYGHGAYPLIAFIRDDTHNGFLAMNEALKALVEPEAAILV